VPRFQVLNVLPRNQIDLIVPFPQQDRPHLQRSPSVALDLWKQWLHLFHSSTKTSRNRLTSGKLASFLFLLRLPLAIHIKI
jgi:hypothetical protein